MYKIIIAGIVTGLVCQHAQSGDIILTPSNGYLGEVPTVEVCEFSYSPSTVFSAVTSLTVDPYTETYGEGSVINSNDGMTCSTCKVPRIEMDKDGVTTIYCEVAK